MDITMALIGAGAGSVVGLVVGLKLGAMRAAQSSAEPLKVMMSSNEVEKHQEALNRMRESNLALTTRLHEFTQRHESTVEALKKAHAMERANYEEELRRVKGQLERIAAAAQDGSEISPNSFAPTQFDLADEEGK